VKRLRLRNRRSRRNKGQGSRKYEVIDLLSTEAGGTLPQLMAATGWQKQSVRGFLNGREVRIDMEGTLPEYNQSSV
jgi:hypothetical protein